MFKFFKNKKDIPDKNNANESINKNWFEERYDNIIVQRNIATLLSFICLFVIIISVFVVVKISLAKRIDPFVIQIEEKSGETKIVNPAGIEVLSGQASLAQYFINLYISARETYNPVDFETQAREIIKLLSNNRIYWGYLSYIGRQENDPRLKYGQRETTSLKIRSWSELEPKKMMVRFSIHESISGKIFNKIAVVQYDYFPIELSQKELYINPVGFQVIGYRVDDDYS